MSINLHIEKLILDGVHITRDQHHLLKNTMTAELTRMLSCDGLSSSLSQGTSFQQRTTSITQLTSPHPLQISQQVAQSLRGIISHE